jgi:fibronectin-binding autotransporter adhesin
LNHPVEITAGLYVIFEEGHMAKHALSRPLHDGRIKTRRCILVLAAGMACPDLLRSSARADVTSTWLNDVSGVWASTTKWSTDYPENNRPSGTDYDAIIGATGANPYTVTYTSTLSVNSCTIDSAQATLEQTGGTLTSGFLNLDSGTYTLDGGTFFDSYIIGSSSTAGVFNFVSGTLNGAVVEDTSFTFNPATDSIVNFLDVNACQVNFQGSLTDGTFSNYLPDDVSTTTIAGTLTNTNLNLPFNSGNWEVTGTVNGGVINLANGTGITGGSPSGAVGIFNGVEIYGFGTNAAIVALGMTIQNGFSSPGGNISLHGTLTFDGPSQSIDNLTIEAESGFPSTLNVDGPTSSGPTTLTLGPNLNVQGSLTFSDPTGKGTLLNNGTINDDSQPASGNSPTTIISIANFINNGTLEATNGGIISIQSSTFTNAGTIAVQSGGIIISTNNLNIGEGTLTGSGTVQANVILDSDPSTLAFNIGGENQGTDYDSLTIDGNMTLAGDLQITLINGFIPNNLDVFTVLEVADGDMLSGNFDNVLDGQRILTADGAGSFLVNYGSGADADEIVLSDFESVPEPTSAGSLLTGSAILLNRRKRRR